MEIDLNHVVREGDKSGNSYGSGGDGGSGSGWGSLSPSSCCLTTDVSPMSSSYSSIYYELWHACAGPLTSLPKKGSIVVYFPQGHLEQAASSSSFPCLEMANFGLQPQIFCRVVNVQLLANKENDEVYTQVTLLLQPEKIVLIYGFYVVRENNFGGNSNEEVGMDEEEGAEGLPSKLTPKMFCKTLTASDTSTHGGFSVPRRAAEDCFPPLDYSQQRPSQELTAKDLHGVQWRFKHIYRGQPRRHLLTTGWSIYVSQKNLNAGDAVLFLRGEDGELRLGIRRAEQPRNIIPNSVLSGQNTHFNVLSPVANAISTKSTFHIFYSPRRSSAEFVIPYQKYLKSISNQITIGMRFKIKVEKEDAAEKSRSGIITGRGDLDPYIWPDSKWRCLKVNWDDYVSDNQEQVSPWEIESSISLPELTAPSTPRMKKLWTSLQSNSLDNPLAGGSGLLDVNESVRSNKVLQGQEKVGYKLPQHGGGDGRTHPVDFNMHNPPSRSLASTGLKETSISVPIQAQPTSYTGLMESTKFQKVLQGQQIFSLRSLHGGTTFNPMAWSKNDLSILNMYQMPNPNAYTPSNGVCNINMPYSDGYRTNSDPVINPFMTNFHRESNLQSHIPSVQRVLEMVRGDARNPSTTNLVKEQTPPDLKDSPAVTATNTDPKGYVEEAHNGTKPIFKLFGISLSGEIPLPNPHCSGKRSCTKVHKQGNLVGRAIDLSRLNSYNDLLIELERLFNMEGLLQDPSKGWQVVYTDRENDMILVGDDPWHEFCDDVSKIHIYTKDEVEKLTTGMISDDTQSCLEEAPAVMDVSKSSSVGQPDWPGYTKDLKLQSVLETELL